MADPDKKLKPPVTPEDKDMQQDSRVTDKDNKDRPGVRPGQPPTTADYDYRPDFGTSGGGADYEQHINGEPDDGKPKKNRQPEGDKPVAKRDQREDKYDSKTPTK